MVFSTATTPSLRTCGRDQSRSTHGGNQSLRYEYRILVSSFKSEKVRLQVWDRLDLPLREKSLAAE
jgi:hypothetical protein